MHNPQVKAIRLIEIFLLVSALALFVIGSLLGVVIALTGGVIVYGALKVFLGIRLSQEEEFEGADLSVHRIASTPDRESNW